MEQEHTGRLLHISTAPHIRHGDSVAAIMIWVAAALVPALAAAVYFFGPRVLILTVVAVAAAVGTEYLVTRLSGKPATIGDFSAVVTGMLLAFNLPAGIPWWMAALGSAFAIGVAKLTFGGLGHNFINPALAGRAFLMASYPAAMTTWVVPRLGFIDGLDGLSGATPLAHIKSAMSAGTFQALDFQEAIADLFWGNVGGCIGETSAVALLIGAAILLYKRIMSLSIPAMYCATVFLLFWLFNGTGTFFTTDALIVPVYHILAGGLLLGALFMATDMVTSPITPKGRIIFGFGCGVLTFTIRKYGGYPEGVSYSILLMNCVVPLIDRYVRPAKYGEVKKRG